VERRPPPVWFREGMASVTAGQGDRRMSAAELVRWTQAHPGQDLLNPSNELYRTEREAVYAAAHRAFELLLELAGDAGVREILRGVGARARSFRSAFAHATGTDWPTSNARPSAPASTSAWSTSPAPGKPFLFESNAERAKRAEGSIFSSAFGRMYLRNVGLCYLRRRKRQQKIQNGRVGAPLSRSARSAFDLNRESPSGTSELVDGWFGGPGGRQDWGAAGVFAGALELDLAMSTVGATVA